MSFEVIEGGKFGPLPVSEPGDLHQSLMEFIYKSPRDIVYTDWLDSGEKPAQYRSTQHLGETLAWYTRIRERVHGAENAEAKALDKIIDPKARSAKEISATNFYPPFLEPNPGLSGLERLHETRARGAIFDTFLLEHVFPDGMPNTGKSLDKQLSQFGIKSDHLPSNLATNIVAIGGEVLEETIMYAQKALKNAKLPAELYGDIGKLCSYLEHGLKIPIASSELGMSNASLFNPEVQRLEMLAESKVSLRRPGLGIGLLNSGNFAKATAGLAGLAVTLLVPPLTISKESEASL